MNDDDEAEQMSMQNSACKELKSVIEGEFGPDVTNDNTISRFLKARDYNVKQAYIMIKKNLEWRKKNKADSIVQDYHVTEFFEKYWGMNFIGFDKEDYAVLVSSFGRMDYKGLTKAVTSEEELRHFIYFYEYVGQKMREHSKEIGGKDISKLTLIADMEEFSLAQVSTKAVIERGIDLCLMNDANYPETLERLYVINASTTFQILYSFLRPFVAPKTQQKIKVYGKDGWKEELLKFIDPQVLPAYLGGERTDPDGNPMCHSVVCHGGPIPERLYMKNFGKSHLKYEAGVKSHMLKRQSKFDLPLKIELVGSVIEWKIETDYYDVGFGLFYKEFTSSEDGEELMVPLIPLQRSDSSQLRESGTLKCEKSGIYILTLDNSYSFFRSKTVYYKVSVVKPDAAKPDVS